MSMLKGTIRHQCLHCSRFFWDDCPYTEFCSIDCSRACEDHDAAIRRIERSTRELARRDSRGSK